MGRRAPGGMAATGGVVKRPCGATPTSATRSVRALVTKQRIVRDLRRLGVEPGQTLLVHASLQSLGWVTGGAPAVVAALREVVGPGGARGRADGDGGELEDLAAAPGPHRDADAGGGRRSSTSSMPAFDRTRRQAGWARSARRCGPRTGAARSAHPQSSFAAIGPEADLLMADHPLECHLGPDSPLGKLNKMDAQVLMIEVGYWAFTGFHLAEYLYTPRPPMRTYACVVAAADGSQALARIRRRGARRSGIRGYRQILGKEDGGQARSGRSRAVPLGATPRRR